MNSNTLDIDIFDSTNTLIARVSFKATNINNEFILSGGRGQVLTDTDLFKNNGVINFLSAGKPLTGVIINQNNLKFDVDYLDFTGAGMFGKLMLTSNSMMIHNVSLKGVLIHE